MYNNPFLYNNSRLLKPGIINTLKKINWSTFLGNANKTLGVINQAIPIVYQIKPIITNAKTVFKIANSLKNSNQDNNKSENVKAFNDKVKNEKSFSPIFYL